MVKKITLASQKIKTERLCLCPLTIDDAEDVFEWVGDPVVNGEVGL